MKLFFLFLALSALSIHASAESKVPQPEVEQGEEWTPQDVVNVDSTLSIMRKKLVEDTGSSAIMKRDAHPKHHGCVKAQLTIGNNSLSLSQKTGLFAKNAMYGAVVRFSNGDPNHKKADKKGDARGLSLKILGVPYDNYLSKNGIEETSKAHDMLFMNSPNFFIKDTKMYAKFMRSVDEGGWHVPWFAVTHPKMLAILMRASFMKVNNPLDIDYHSATPYKLGPDSMKIRLVTCKVVKDSKPRRPDDNFLGTRLADYLKDNSSCFDLFVQPNRKPEVNLVENPMIIWGTKKSPLIKVGKLEIQSQTGIHSSARQEFCENASFNPWRAPEENRPLGAINRTRLEVYVKQARFRQEHNKVIAPLPSDVNDIP